MLVSRCEDLGQMMGERRAAIQEGGNENHSQQPEVLHHNDNDNDNHSHAASKDSPTTNQGKCIITFFNQVNKNLFVYFSILRVII